jgi:hypothetical protein
MRRGRNITEGDETVKAVSLVVLKERSLRRELKDLYVVRDVHAVRGVLHPGLFWARRRNKAALFGLLTRRPLRNQEFNAPNKVGARRQLLTLSRDIQWERAG